MFCGKCGRQIPDGSIFCPLCGASLANKTPEKKDFSQETMSRYGQPSYQKPAEPVYPPTDQPVSRQSEPQWQTGAQPQVGGAQPQYQQPSYQQAPQYQQPQAPQYQQPNAQQNWQTGSWQAQGTPQLQPFQQYQEPENAPKNKKKKSGSGKKKGLLAAAIGGGVLVILALVCVFFWSQVSNFFVKTFSSPEKYYQYVESRNVGDIAGKASTIYDQVVLQSIDTENRRIEYTLSIKPEEPLVELLTSASHTDFDWLQEIKLSGYSNFSEGMGKAEQSIYLNKDQLLSLNGVFDMDKNIYYLQIPEFSEDWIKIDPYDMISGGQIPISMSSTIYSASSVMSQLSNILPDSEMTDRLIRRYGQIVLEQIHDVSKETETLKIRGVSGRYTALSMEIDEDTVKDIMTAVFDALKEDEDIESLIKTLAPIYGPAVMNMAKVDEDDFYDFVIERIEKAEDEIDDFFMDDPIEMKIWVDGTGEIVARKINYRSHEAFIGMTESGSDFGLEISYSRDDNEYISLKGSGTKKNEKLTGTLSLEVQEKEFAEIELENLDQGQLEKGFLDGKFVMYPTELAFQAAGLSRYTQQFKSFLSDLGILVEGKTTNSESSVTMQILTDDDPFLTISMDSKKEKAEEVDKVKGAKDITSWAQNMDPSKIEDFLDDLENTDLPKELLTYLRNIVSGKLAPSYTP